MWFFLKNTGTVLRGGYFRFQTKYLMPFPLPKLNHVNEQQPFIENANKMLKLTQTLQHLSGQFTRTLERKFTQLTPLPKALKTWYLLDFAGFIKQLSKKKITLTLEQEVEWETHFLTQQQKVVEIKTQMDQTDQKINQMVYKLYDLNEEEIQTVKNSPPH